MLSTAAQFSIVASKGGWDVGVDGRLGSSAKTLLGQPAKWSRRLIVVACSDPFSLTVWNFLNLGFGY